MLVSVILCSIDDAKLAAANANYRERLAGTPHEIVAVRDARSLAEAYNRAAESTRGEVLVFSHDDVEHLRDDFARVLAQGLERFDIVGAAGTTRCTDAYWPAAGHPHIHGACAAPGPAGKVTVALYGIEGPRVEGVEALDGMFMAARREAWSRVRFDAATFDGFHGYDADFTLRAARLGLRVGIENGFLVLHRSAGNFGDEWQRYRTRFLAKHFPGMPVAPPRRPPLMALEFASRADCADRWSLDQAIAMTAELRARAAASVIPAEAGIQDNAILAGFPRSRE